MTAGSYLQRLVGVILLFVTTSFAQSTTSIRCNDGSTAGTGGFTPTSGCAKAAEFYRNAGCTVSASDVPTGEIDTLTISCPGPIPPLDPNIDPNEPDGMPEDRQPVGELVLCDYSDFLVTGVQLYCLVKDINDPDVPSQRIRLSFTTGGFEGTNRARPILKTRAKQTSGEYSQVLTSTTGIGRVFLAAQNIDPDGQSTGEWVPIGNAKTRSKHVCTGGKKNVSKGKVQNFRQELEQLRKDGFLRARLEKRFALGSMCQREVGATNRVTGSNKVRGTAPPTTTPTTAPPTTTTTTAPPPTTVRPLSSYVGDGAAARLNLAVSEKQPEPLNFRMDIDCSGSLIRGSEPSAQRAAIKFCKDLIATRAEAELLDLFIRNPSTRLDLARFTCFNDYAVRTTPIWRVPFALWRAEIESTGDCLFILPFE